MIGASRPVLKTPMSFPSSIREHFRTMQATWNGMIKIHAQTIIPLLLPVPKWESDARSERIEVGDLIYMKRKEQSHYAPCFSCAIVEECHTSEDGVDRILTVKYVGPEIMRREGTKDDDEWPPQSKKRKIEMLDIDEVRLRTTVKDSRSII